MTYTIFIEGLAIEAIIGVLPFEREEAQLIIADCEIDYTRDNEQYVNYADVAEIITAMLIEQQYLLLEDALDEIISEIVSQNSTITSIKLKLAKPQILDNCTVGVELFRKI